MANWCVAMKIGILGAGRMGRAIAYYLKQKNVDLRIGDLFLENAKALADKYEIDDYMKVDASNSKDVLNFFEGIDSAISALPYDYNLSLAKLAIKTGVHFTDLGGNNDIVQKELELDENAEAAGVSIVPDMGLAPGLVSILAMDGYKRVKGAHTIKIRVGGLPQDPQPPLNYMIVFSVHGLVNEYVEPSIIIRNGKIMTVESMTEIEDVKFREPYGTLECFHTSGGVSTLPYTLEGKIQNLDYKTIRYPGHCNIVKAMLDIGLASEDPIQVNSVEVKPRDVFEKVLENNLPKEGKDLVLLKVIIEGKGNKKCMFEMIEYYDEETDLTAMMRTTGFPIALLSYMQAKGEIELGAKPPELAIQNTEEFIKTLIKDDLPIEMVEGTHDRWKHCDVD